MADTTAVTKELKIEWDEFCRDVHKSCGMDTTKHEESLLHLINPDHKFEVLDYITYKYLKKVEAEGLTIKDALEFIKAKASRQGKLH